MPERRAVMLGDVIGVEAGAVIGLDELQPRLVEIAQRLAAAVDMVEDAEFHRLLLRYADALLA